MPLHCQCAALPVAGVEQKLSQHAGNWFLAALSIGKKRVRGNMSLSRFVCACNCHSTLLLQAKTILVMQQLVERRVQCV